MHDTIISVIHNVIPSEKPFAQVVAALEAQLGHLPSEQLSQLVQSSTSADQFAQAVEPFVGPSGFTIFAEFDHGYWISKFGKTRRAKLYILGNPLFAKDLLEQDIRAGLYVPTRLYAYEADRGLTQLAYDRLSDLTQQFHNEALTHSVEMVDQKLAALIARAAG